VVEILVPPDGLGRHLDDMHEFHRQRRIKAVYVCKLSAKLALLKACPTGS